jgi:SAM-dependent methyltransferase
MSHRHVCPVWMGYLLANPVRALFQDPEKILGPHVAPGMRVLDIGCAMGFFSLPLARLVGPGGRVICVDLQQTMLDSLARRARRAHLRDRIEIRRCDADSLCVTEFHGQIDFALLFAVIHEVDIAARLFTEVRDALRPSGRVVFAEPKGHIPRNAFDESVSVAERSGLRKIEGLRIPWSHAVLLET